MKYTKWVVEYLASSKGDDTIPVATTYDTEEEAIEAMKKLRRDNPYEVPTNIHHYRWDTVMYTEEDLAKRAKREVSRLRAFDYKEDSDDYGMYYFADGSKSRYYLKDFIIYFIDTKEAYDYLSLPILPGDRMRSLKYTKEDTDYLSEFFVNPDEDYE